MATTSRAGRRTPQGVEGGDAAHKQGAATSREVVGNPGEGLHAAVGTWPFCRDEIASATRLARQPLNSDPTRPGLPCVTLRRGIHARGFVARRRTVHRASTSRVTDRSMDLSEHPARWQHRFELFIAAGAAIFIVATPGALLEWWRPHATKLEACRRYRSRSRVETNGPQPLMGSWIYWDTCKGVWRLIRNKCFRGGWGFVFRRTSGRLWVAVAGSALVRLTAGPQTRRGAPMSTGWVPPARVSGPSTTSRQRWHGARSSISRPAPQQLGRRDAPSPLKGRLPAKDVPDDRVCRWADYMGRRAGRPPSVRSTGVHGAMP